MNRLTDLQSKQTAYIVELENLKIKLNDREILILDEVERYRVQLENIETGFRKIATDLSDLFETEPSFKSSFGLNADKMFFKNLQEAKDRLEWLDKKRTENIDVISGPSTSTTSMTANFQELQKQLELMSVRLNAYENGASGLTGNDAIAAQLLMEMKASRNPLKFPSFPKEINVFMRYHEWRCRVKNFVSTNSMEDSVRLQFLHESTKGTVVADLVDRFTPGYQSFTSCLAALDSRYLIARNIATEFVNSVVNLGKGKTAKHLKEVLDGFGALVKNLESIVRETLEAKGIENPSTEVMQRTLIDALYLGLLMRTLDDTLKTYLATNLKLETMEIPRFTSVLSALERRYVAVQGCDGEKNHVVHVSHVSHAPKSNAVNKKSSCIVCNSNTHATTACRRLAAAKTFPDKVKLLKQSKEQTCWICLEKPFKSCDCKTRGNKCSKCNGSHHRSLCTSSGPTRGGPVRSEPRAALATVATSIVEPRQKVLGTLLVKIKSRKTGKFVVLRALVDDGSMVSFITTHAAQRLSLPVERTFKEVRSVDGELLPNIERETTLELFDYYETFDAPYIVSEVALTNKIPLILPAQPLHFVMPNNMGDQIKLADPHFDTPGAIDILLGVDAWTEIQMGSSVRIKELRFQRTIFGSIAQGTLPAKNNHQCNLIVSTIITADSLNEIKRDFKNVFEYEKIPEEEEEFAEITFKEMHKRLENGKYQVPLILSGESELGDSYNACFKRNQRLFEKLSEEQIEKVINVLKEQKRDNIISICEDEKTGGFYNPFVLVWRDKLTSPLRICLDGSQRTTSGLSANDVQLKGIKLQPSLVQQLLRFRKHPYCIISDITQMYLMIEIIPEHRKYQRSILNLPKHKVQEIEWRTVLFGSACAPFLAQRVIKQLAIDEKERFPLASSVLNSSAYIDDITFSSPSIQEGKAILNELIKATSSASFQLHKIASNCDDLLVDIEEHRKLRSLDPSGRTSVLGVQWDYNSDEIYIKTTLKPIVKLTKRAALSIVASVFDPLGIIGACVLPARLIIQEVWMRDRELKSNDLASTWDKELPEDLKERFMIWYEDIQSMGDVRFPRNVGFNDKLDQSIYIFCDASLLAFGAISYLRSVDEDGKVQFTLLASKSRVAPVIAAKELKTLSIPRLELCAALVGAQLAQTIREAWELKDDFPLKMFTDSEIVLAQISSDAIRDVFSERRLRKIRDLVSRDNWYHVATDSNPADVISRGCTVADLKGIWSSGPELMKQKDFLPQNKFFPYKTEEIVSTVIRNDGGSFSFLSTSMSFKHSIRVMAWTNRIFLKEKPKSLKLELDETERARMKIILLIQKQFYGEEISLLSQRKPIVTGILRTKNPFIDRHGILRIASRVQLAEIDYDERNPIVLPQVHSKDKENHISYQVIFDIHHDNIHGGVSATSADVKQRYFIPCLRYGVTKIISSCQRCEIIKAKSRVQIMGNLPKEVILKNPAFFNICLDYCGPISIRSKLRRSKRKLDDSIAQETYDKCWVLLIACYSTGAYFIELIPDLEATSFLRAFECFVATRGLPHSVRSDNATTFHKSAKLLDGVFEKYRESLIDGDNTIKELCAAKNIKWNFNVPLASHFGGRFERGIRSVREKLRNAIGLSKLRYVDLHACLKKIEGVLNSRPLIRARGNLEDGDCVITPGHLLIGRSINMLPNNNFPTKNHSLIEAYKIRNQIEETFFKKYHLQHLQEIANRSKWYRSSENVEVGDLVLLREDNNLSLAWRKGVVIKTMPGKDGRVRVVRVKTATSEFERSISKIVVIPWGIAPDQCYQYDVSEDNNQPIADVPVSPINISQGGDPIINDSDQEDVVMKDQTIVDSNNSKSEPKVIRRSDRIAKKKGIISTIISFCLFAMAFADPSGVKVNSNHGGGAMLYEKNKIMLSEGKFHVFLQTNATAETDASKMLSEYNRFWNICHQSWEKNGVRCGVSLFEVREKLEEVIPLLESITSKNLTDLTTYYFQQIIPAAQMSRFEATLKNKIKFAKSDKKTGGKSMGKFAKLSKIRGKRETGWVWRFLSWAFSFGSSDTSNDITHDKSSGEFSHTVESIKGMGRSLYRHEQLLQEEYKRLEREFEYQKSATDQNALESQFHRMSSAIKGFIDKTMFSYTSHAITDKELLEMINMVDYQVMSKAARVPIFDLQHLKPLIKINILYVDNVVLSVEFPLVSLKEYHQMVIVPFPDDVTKTIIDSEIVDVILSNKDQEYIDIKDATFTRVNETFSIVESQVIHSITSSTICAIRLVTMPSQTCGVKPLSNSTELWYMTPLHNVVQFIDFGSKSLVCPTNRTAITVNFGVISIPTQCYIRTENYIIRSTLDETKVSRQMVKVSLEEIDDLFNKSSIASRNFTRKIPDNIGEFFNDGKFKEILDDIDVKTVPFGWWHWVIVTVNGVIFIGLIITIIICCNCPLDRCVLLAKARAYRLVRREQPSADNTGIMKYDVESGSVSTAPASSSSPVVEPEVKELIREQTLYPSLTSNVYSKWETPLRSTE